MAQVHAEAHAHAHKVKKYSGLMDWLTTVDHKKIGIMYYIAGGLFFLIGGIEAVLMRLQLMYPDQKLFVFDTFNQLTTMHGTTMIFLAVMPVIIGFMNAVVPLQIGARDVAFPFLNSLGFWLFLLGGILLNTSWFLGGAPNVGWTAYTPLSTLDLDFKGVDFYALGLQIAGLGTLIGGINFLVTIINMRAPGMTFMRMPMFTWTTFVTSVLILFAFPAITVGLVQLTFDRIFHGGFYDPAKGGNNILWEHLFWIFGHPEVYILILPAFGIISEVVSTFAKKRLFGYSSMVFASVLIGFLGFMVWVHHMFTASLGPVANSIFAVATMAIAVPTGIKIFNWLFTLWGGQITFSTAALWATAFIPTFVMGGTTGVMLAVPAADFQYHDTYFVIAHFHYVLVGGLVFGLFAGSFYWWPKMFGRMLNETLGKIHFWFFFIGFHLTFFPQHFLGLMGMQRRIFTYAGGEGLDEGNLISSVGAILMSIGVIIFMINMIVTGMKPKGAPNDPWNGRTLEWTISSPPPEYNFKQTPLVRGLDAFWVEKMAGNKEMTPAEPVGSIHMPSPTILPLVMTIGLTVAAYSLIFGTAPYPITIVGIAITFIAMFLRSVFDDHGYHIEPSELEDKGGESMSANAHGVNELPMEPEKATLEGKNKVLGFWLFFGGETVLFGCLFATYLALRNSVGDGKTSDELFQLPMIALATFLLLTSSLTSVFAVMALHRHRLQSMLRWLAISVVLGLAFLGLEIYEFVEYVHEGHGFTTSAFSTSFYSLVGFHGAHVLFGILWISLLIIQGSKKGLTTVTAPKFYIAALYWHFIDVVWVFIFTVVYLMGKVA